MGVASASAGLFRFGTVDVVDAVDVAAVVKKLK